MNSDPGTKVAAGKATPRQEVASFVKTLLALLVLAVFLRGTVVEAFKIPSGSMIPTLMPWDHILVCKFSYGLRLPFLPKMLLRWAQPQRGDIVVFTRPDDVSTPEDEGGVNIIKRVIGLPGDMVEVRGTRVYINNALYFEDYVRYEEGGIREGDFGPEKIPGGHILMLGDNRDHSKDSRFWSYPFLDIDRVKGRALIIYWSWDDWRRIGKIIR